MRWQLAAALALMTLGGCCSAGPGRTEPPPAAELQARVDELRRDSDLRGFTVIAASPFVVIGNGRRADVEAYTDQVIRWAYRLLRQDFFALEPGKILEIWIFRNEDSYRSNHSRIFGGVPDTPYGFYAPCDDAIIINVAYGAGTLVHELVHPLMEANFPGVPTWFNEGLASLLERPVEQDGHIHGRPNWRLPILQRAIKAGRMPTFESLTAASKLEFYDDDNSSVYYALARYLCFYLQEKGLLRQYYRRFRASRKADPTGYESLLAVLGQRDPAAVHADFVAFVLKLTQDDD